MIASIWRRREWLFGKMRPGQFYNLVRASVSCALKRQQLAALPAVVKIDISPLCNLACTLCLHSKSVQNRRTEGQVFAADHQMRIEQFSAIIDQLRGKTLAVSLYTWGDPLMHADLDRMCQIASDAGLQVHVSTNYSFKFSDQRIQRLVESGLTHLTVCVDGLSQENYQKTRVGGRIDWVLDNLKRTLQVKRELDRKYPLVEVQYIKYQHNVHELQPAQQLVEGWGIDKFTSYWGALHNMSDVMPEHYHVGAPKEDTWIPHCFWPYFSMVIKYNGDVIPCCEFRSSAQHIGRDSRGDSEARVIGNVFESSVKEIWNSEPYQQARQLVSRPRRVEDDKQLEQSYCHGCFKCFETTVDDDCRRWADQHHFDDIYQLDLSGRPTRREPRLTGLPH